VNKSCYWNVGSANGNPFTSWLHWLGFT